MMAKMQGQSFGATLIASLEEALAHERGEIDLPTKTVSRTERDVKVVPPPRYDSARIRTIRLKLGYSQRVFARALNVSLPTVRAWERGSRKPDGPTQRLLQIAEEYPEALAGNVQHTEPMIAD